MAKKSKAGPAMRTIEFVRDTPNGAKGDRCEMAEAQANWYVSNRLARYTDGPVSKAAPASKRETAEAPESTESTDAGA